MTAQPGIPRLGPEIAHRLPGAVRRPGYDRKQLRPGIVHIGAGAAQAGLEIRRPQVDADDAPGPEARFQRIVRIFGLMTTVEALVFAWIENDFSVADLILGQRAS